MRHLKAGRKLNRDPKHRRALLRNLVTSLLERDRVRTTDAKAKELRRLADRMVTLGKKGTLDARRRAMQLVRKRSAVRRLFSEIAPRFGDRAGGYTRVLKVGIRSGDAAPMSIVEFTALVLAEEKPASGGGRKKGRRRLRLSPLRGGGAGSGEKEKG